MVELAGVALAVGGWIASPLIGTGIGMLKSYLEDKHELYEGMKDRLDTVQLALPRIEEAINAAEGWPIKGRALVEWLRHLKDAAYEAEDLLDDLQSKVHHDENKVRASRSSNLQPFKRRILTNDDRKNLKNLANKLDRICTGIDQRLEELDQHSEYIRDLIRKKRSFFFPREVIGRNKETDVIVRRLSSYRAEEGASGTPSFVVVLPIVGIGGAGKTTLARHIFEWLSPNNKSEKNHFEDERLSPNNKSQKNPFPLSTWLEVSDNLNIKNIANKLVNNFLKKKNVVSEIVDDHRYDDTSLEYILHKLKNIINDERFLIVLDDVWNVETNAWDELHKALKCGATGSTVLITTQYQRVAKEMRTVDSLELDLLKEDDYQKLLEERAFGDQVLEEHERQDLQSISRKISKILQGLPRAGNALGNLLRSNLNSDHWNTILNSKWWENDTVLEDVLPSLGLNYQNLKASEKLCFAYCSIFPKGHRFEEDRLVHMWMAQGFIQPKPGGTMRIEDIGRQVFAELVDRNLFQQISQNEYGMQPIIRELAVYLSSGECFVIDDDETNQIPPTVRHLTVKSHNLDALNDLSMVEKLRTILFFGNYEEEKFCKVLKNISKYSKSLRVLDLSYSNTEISRLPNAIGNLSHLRYLDISNTKIKRLPELFCKLCHLQVLNLQQCHFNELPEGMNKLINLRHLCAESKTVSLISGIGKLTCLQELKEFHVRKKKGHKIEELRNLNKLRGQLLIQNLENVDSMGEAMNAKLREKEHLDALHLYFEIKDGLVTGSSFILTRLLKGSSKSKITPDLKGLLGGLEPCCDIKELGIKGYDRDMFPSWLIKEHFTSLKYIYLSSCDKLTRLPPLGQLPSLRVLHIEAMPALRKIGVELYGNVYNVFPSLVDLKLQGLQEFEEWSEVQGRQLFPRLRKLHIENCLKLTRLDLLMRNPPVQELQINSCGDLGLTLPECLQRLTSLTMLKISDYRHRTSLSLSNLVALKNLCLSNCPELSFRGELQSLTDLKQLEITGCPKLCKSLQLKQLHENSILLGNLPELQILKIFSCSQLVRLSEEQEMWLQQLTSLQELQFSNCDYLQYLPNRLVALSSLEKLTICDCPLFKSLPKKLLPASLRELHISGCPLLKEQCQKERGPDWRNIAHVPRIYIDQEIIQELQEESSDIAATSIS